MQLSLSSELWIFFFLTTRMIKDSKKMFEFNEGSLSFSRMITVKIKIKITILITAKEIDGFHHHYYVF